MTMRKIYMQPATVIEASEMEQIIATSLVEGFMGELGNISQDGGDALVLDDNSAINWSELVTD